MGFSKRDKGKGKEVIRDVILEEDTAVAGRSIFDFDDGPPPSAQPAEKRGRRDSDSKARKRRKAAQSSLEKWNGGPEAEVSDELLDQTGLGYANGDFRHGDDMGAEPQDAGETSTTHTQPTDAGEYQAAAAVSSILSGAPTADLQPANSDSGYAEPDGQAPSGSKPTENIPVFDDPPYYEDNDYASPGGEAVQNDDAAVSVTSEPHGSPVVSDAPFSPAGSHAGDEEEFDVHMEEQAPLQDNPDPVSTPPQSSAKSTGSRPSAKRKTKMPFLARQEEENAEAFAELPHEDVASPPKPRRSKRAPKSQSPAQAEAGPSVVAPKTKRKSKKQPEADVADAAAEDSDEQGATGGSQYRSGPLSNTEQARITRAVERFRQDEDLTQEELNQVIHDNPQTSERPINGQLWAAIQDACPSRPRKKLISWCRQRFHNFAARGTWTEEQDDELADLIEKYGKRWSHIAGLINRYQKDVRDRWRNYLVCRGTVKTDVWSEDEEERFRELVENSIEKIKEGLSASSRKSPETLINWLDISQAMGHTRSRLQCMEKWKRMRAAEPLPDQVPTVLPPGTSWRLEKARVDLRTMNADDKYALMREVRDSGVGADTKINWKHIVHVTFGGKYERQALVVAWGRLRKAVPDWEWKTTRDCAQYLCDMYEREGNFGTEEHDENEEAENSIHEDTAASSNPRSRKGKEVVRPTSADSTSALRSQVVDDSSKESLPKRDKTKRKRKSTAGSSQAISTTVETADEDVVMEDQDTAQHATSGGEDEMSPDLDAGSLQPSPSVKAQASRSKRRDRGGSPVEWISANKGKENEISSPTPEAPSAKVSKRSRRRSLSNSNAESPKPKKRKTSTTSSSASKKKANGVKASNINEDQEATRGSRAWSELSSDMDDMEDIPATLPESSQVL
jgi:hypothetical protein